jgi:hypothetical protein
VRKDGIWDDVRTKEVAAKLAGPKPPENPLARIIAPSADSPFAPSEVVARAEQAAKRLRALRKLGGLTGAHALLAALLKR